MNPDIINALLRSAKHPAVTVAEETNTSPAHVSNVIHQRTRSTRIAEHIARVIGEPVSVIWPGVYDTPARPGPRRAVRK